MPDPGTGVLAATTVIGVGQAKSAQSDANRASRKGLAQNQRQFDLVREDTALARELGAEAMQSIGFILGIKSAPSADDLTAIDAELEAANALPTKRKVTSTNTYGKNDQHERTTTRYVGDGVMEQEKRNKIAALQKKRAGMVSMQGVAEKYKDGLAGFVRSQPGYKFEMEEGQKAITNQLSSSGVAHGGNALKAATKFSQNLASSKADKHMNKLFTVAGYGQQATAQSAQAGQTLSMGAMQHGRNLADTAYATAGANISQANNFSDNYLALNEYNKNRIQNRNLGEAGA